VSAIRFDEFLTSSARTSRRPAVALVGDAACGGVAVMIRRLAAEEDA
jgi:hypothetical protein